MYRGSTPTHVFDVNIDLRGATIYVSYSQDDVVLVEKSNSDLVVTKSTVTLRLTQEDTLLFQPGQVNIQIRYAITGGFADASKIMRVMVYDVLKEGVI